MQPMKSLSILIVEDETVTAMDLCETLEEFGHCVLAVTHTYEQAIEAVATKQPDLALIDIQLDNSAADGITTAQTLLARHPMPIIYLTANSELPTFQVAKQTKPAAYLLKPFRHDELRIQIELAYYNFHLNNKDDSTRGEHLYLPVDKGYEKVEIADVLYLKADGAYVKVFMLGREQPHHISTNLSHLAQYFMIPNFYRLSRSLLINLNHLERIERSYLFIAGHKTALPIPVVNRKELIQKLNVVRTK